MMHIITYDIQDDKVRNSVSKILEDYEIRVQESVFECNLDSNKYYELIERLIKFTSGEISIRIYPICKSCYLKAVGIAEIKTYPGLKGYEII